MRWFLQLIHVLLIFQLPICKSSSIADLFSSWCQQYGKNYTSDQEKQYRLKVFEQNYEYVTRHNEMANASYTLALNAFADLTKHEFKAKYLGLSLSARDSVIRLNSMSPVDGDNLLKESDIPSSLDWRSKGAVTGVKDQGSCGACWSFSATGAIEGINKIVAGSLVSLSEQELIDCDKSYNAGCGGGLMDYAYEFIIKNKGIDTEEDYPFQGRDKTCNNNKLKQRAVTIDSYVDIPSEDEKRLLQVVATQPVSVGICGSETGFQLYSKGIFTGPCSTSLDHAVLIVGYDSKDGKDYWIIKNSWGKSWGIDGYMHMLRNGGNSQGVCGINTLASYPVKTSPNPPPSPSPGPTKCSIFTSCSRGETCCCSQRFLGLCLYWKCCGAVSAVSCKDNLHCFPQEYPVCDTKRNLRLKRTANSTLIKQVAMAKSSSERRSKIFISQREIGEMAAEEGQVFGCHTVEEWRSHFQKGVESKKLVVIDFTAAWCGPCRFIAPVFAEIAKKTAHVIFLKVDVDELEPVAKEFKVEAMPTFVFLKEGQEVDRVVGARKEDLAAKISLHGTVTA